MITKIILILVFFIIVNIVYSIYNMNYDERLTIISYDPPRTATPTPGYVSPETFDDYLNKKIYLKCKIDSKYYYLVTLSKSLFPELSVDVTKDCMNTIVVLIDSDIFERRKQEYLKKNYKTKEFLGEFMVRKYDDKYVFRSSDNENIDNTVKPTMLNQILYTSYNTNKLCGDTMTYYSSSEFKHLPEIDLRDVQNINGKISFKMEFLTDVVVNSIQDGKPMFLKIFDANDKPLKQKSFVGLSNETVKLNDDILKRVNLYYEFDKANVSNILRFEVELVNF